MSIDSPLPAETPLRDRLALERTHLANERTLLAYGRTAIMLTATGATLLKIYGNGPLAIIGGWTLIVAGIGTAVIGARRYRKLARTL